MAKETIEPTLNRIAQALEIIALSQAHQACSSFYAANPDAPGIGVHKLIQEEMIILASELKNTVGSHDEKALYEITKDEVIKYGTSS
ncbi:MAG TPA: hypothetical protein VF596_04815 [Pyrinomonadaceae bacterium]|jgi:hypothetical protein